MAVLEFDDQGELRDPSQRSSILSEIRLRQPDTVLIFAHGWNNNADPTQTGGPCNRSGNPMDLAHFDTLLSTVRDQTKDSVVGVYIGWRGRSKVNDLDHYLNLDERRKVARRIGGGADLRESIEQITSAARSVGKPVKVLAIGHSLGGCLMEKLAGQMHAGYVCDQKPVRPSSLARTPDLFLLVNNAEVASQSAGVFEAINRAPRTLAMLESDELIVPRVINLTGDGDGANRIVNPINSALHFRGFEGTAAFTEPLLTHQLAPNDNVLVPKMDVRTLSSMPLLEPALFVQGGAPPRTQDEYQGPYRYVSVVPIRRRSESAALWNFRIPETAVQDHCDLYNQNALAVALAMSQMAQPYGQGHSGELEAIPDRDVLSIKAARDAWRERLLQSRPPTQLSEMLRLEKKILRIRGENSDKKDSIKPTVDDVFTSFSRQLFHGLKLRLPYNERNVDTLLKELEDLDQEPLTDGSFGPMKQGKANDWPGDWRRRYATRIFEILKYSHDEAGAWTPKNIATLLRLRNETPVLIDCLDNVEAGEAKTRFKSKVDSWSRPG